MLLGEGNFSFALSLATSLGSGMRLVATSREALAVLQCCYDEIGSTLSDLQQTGGQVPHPRGALNNVLQCRRGLMFVNQEGLLGVFQGLQLERQCWVCRQT